MESIKSKIERQVKQIFEDYVKEFGGEGFADNDIPQIIKRTISRKRVEFLDKRIDELNLTQEDLDAYQKELDTENLVKAEQLFETYLENKDYRMAEYQINNYKKVWSLEKRKEMAKRIGDSYTINPITGLVDTEHNVKKELKKLK